MKKQKLLLHIILIFIFSIIILNNNCFASSFDYINSSQKAGANATVVFESGDVTGDNNINIRDIIITRKYIANPNKWNLTETEKKKADVDGNTIVNIRDIIKIRKYIAAKSSSTIATKHPDWLNLYKITTSSITVTTNPSKTTYKKGESLNLSGGIVTVRYSDNTSSTISLDSSQVTVTGYNSSNLGEQTLTVKYLGETTTFKVTVTSNEKFDISSNTLNNGSVILAGDIFKMYIDINITNYNVDTNQIRILNPDEISLSGAIVKSSSTVEKGGATTSNFNVTISGNRIIISAKTSAKINEIGYLVVELKEGFLTASGYSSTPTHYTYYVASLNASTKLSNSKVSLTTTVGVHNSFYIKNYYYGDVDKKYNQNISTTGKTASTTNEYTYTDLSNASHKITVEIEFYIDKNNKTYTKSGMISKTFSVSSNSNDVEIHYIDLGNGSTQDAIFLKIPDGNSYKTMLIDAGRLETVDTLDKYLRKDNNLVSVTKTENGNLNCVHIDYLLLTHFDGDHYGGLISTEKNGTFVSSLTGITYNADNGYNQNRTTNKLNNQQMFYDFSNVILPCNYKDVVENIIATYKNKDEDKDKENKLRALCNYAEDKKSEKTLVKVTAGNVLQIDNVTFNIFNPYPTENVPLEWLGDYYKGNQYFRNQEWVCKKEGSEREENNIVIYNDSKNAKGVTRLAQTCTNNSSVVTKLIVGSGKTLLAGDLTFYGEEILLGKIPEELKKNGNNGLAINEIKEKTPYTNYINLVKDLSSKENITEGQLDQKYHLSRFTAKDLSANILKKGHHYYWNSTSTEFLENVQPSKVIVTNVKSTKYPSDFKNCVLYDSLIYRLEDYFDIPNSNSWYNCIYGTNTNKIISYSNGTLKNP